MIFKDKTCEAGIDSRTLDIHVRLALPDVHQQKRFCFWREPTERLAYVGPPLRRRTSVALRKPYQ